MRVMSVGNNLAVVFSLELSDLRCVLVWTNFLEETVIKLVI